MALGIDVFRDYFSEYKDQSKSDILDDYDKRYVLKNKQSMDYLRVAIDMNAMESDNNHG